MFQAGHLLCSKQDISCVPSRTSPVFQAGHLLCSKQDISYVPRRTSLVFKEGHLLWPDDRKSTSHFLVNSADCPGIIPDRGGLWSESRDDRPNSQKSGMLCFGDQTTGNVLLGTQEMSCLKHRRCPAWNTRDVLPGTHEMSCVEHRK